jgi:hypothetical protein
LFERLVSGCAVDFVQQSTVRRNYDEAVLFRKQLLSSAKIAADDFVVNFPLPRQRFKLKMTSCLAAS